MCGRPSAHVGESRRRILSQKLNRAATACVRVYIQPEVAL
jgi:hypothetical protein